MSTPAALLCLLNCLSRIRYCGSEGIDVGRSRLEAGEHGPYLLRLALIAPVPFASKVPVDGMTGALSKGKSLGVCTICGAFNIGARQPVSVFRRMEGASPPKGGHNGSPDRNGSYRRHSRRRPAGTGRRLPIQDVPRIGRDRRQRGLDIKHFGPGLI
jgi:hypothetical protein